MRSLPRKLLERIRRRLGYDERNWLRIRQIEAFNKYLSDLGPVSVLEISPGWNRQWKKLVTDYTSVDYPEFDICKDILPMRFDVVIADQVLEHVPRPLDAIRNIRAMIKPGGHAMIATPFLFRIHARPHDYTRWTPEGLKQILTDAGFEESEIVVDAWGNKACARAHIGGPVRDFGFGRDLSNDPEYPMMVWAIAKAQPSSRVEEGR